jgi:hypothetical protein
MMNKLPKFNPKQHLEMFKSNLVTVYCDTHDDSEAFKRYLKSIGYIWCDGDDLFDCDVFYEGDQFYVHDPDAIGTSKLLLCADPVYQKYYGELVIFKGEKNE